MSLHVHSRPEEMFNLTNTWKTLLLQFRASLLAETIIYLFIGEASLLAETNIYLFIAEASLLAETIIYLFIAEIIFSFFILSPVGVDTLEDRLRLFFYNEILFN